MLTNQTFQLLLAGGVWLPTAHQQEQIFCRQLSQQINQIKLRRQINTLWLENSYGSQKTRPTQSSQRHSFAGSQPAQVENRVELGSAPETIEPQSQQQQQQII